MPESCCDSGRRLNTTQALFNINRTNIAAGFVGDFNVQGFSSMQYSELFSVGQSVAVAGGWSHSVSLDANGTVWAWF